MSDIKSLIEKQPLKYRSILIFGPPGAGKGTLGKFLATAGNHVHLSSGDIFRGLSSDSPAGKLHQAYSHQGNLVPDDVTLAIWHHYVEGLIATNRYFPQHQLLLLDGIPRTLPQVKMIESYVDILHVIVLETSNPEELIQRMRRRALIEKRPDDANESILRTRMEVYEKTTQSILSHLPSHLMTRIHANQKPLEVLRDVLVKLSPIF